MILAAVKLRPECAAFFYKLLGKYREMTYIIVGPKVIRGKIGLEMQRYHIVYRPARKGRFITIYVVGILFAYDLHVFVKSRRMKNIIMVKQSDVIALCHLKAFVRVAGYPQVFGKLFISDAYIPIGLYDLTHIFMVCVGAVGKTELPPRIGLRHNGIYHLPEKILRCIVQRNKYGKQDFPRKRRLLLSFSFLLGGHRKGAVAFICAPFYDLAFDLALKIGNTAVSSDTYKEVFSMTPGKPEGIYHLPDHRIAKLIHLVVNIGDRCFRIYKLLRKIGTLSALLLIQILIVFTRL